mgnify:CR=1 FL=1
MEHAPLTPLSSAALLIGRDALLAIWKARDPRMDPVDALILATVIQANVDGLTSSLSEQMIFGGLDQPPPGALRRRVSINRVADSLNLRFETVRRRIKRLEALGLIETSRQGAMAPERYFHTEANRQAVVEADRMAADAYFRLDSLGFFEAHPLPPAIAAPITHPYRAVARLFMTYALRVGGEMRALVGDYPNLMLVLQLTQLNSRLGADVRPAASISALSRASRIPFETARRRLSRLEQAGLCRMNEAGYVVPRRVAIALAVQLAACNEMNLLRLYRACAQLGAVEGWRGGRTELESKDQRLAS